MGGMSRWGRSQTWEQTDPAVQEARPGGAGGRGGLPRSPRRGSAGGSFPEDSGHGGERKRRRQLHNIWQWRSPPGTLRRPITGGLSQHRASCHPSAARCAPPLPPAPCTPTLPPHRPLSSRTCPTPASQFSPSSPAHPSSVPVHQRSQDPAVPPSARGTGDLVPILRWPRGTPSARVPKWGAFPSPAPRCHCPVPGQAPSSPRTGGTRQSRARVRDHPIPASTSHPIPPAPESSWIQTAPSRELPIAQPQQIAG